MMKEFPQKEWSSLDRIIQTIKSHGMSNRRPVSGRRKSVKTTNNIAVVQDLICSQDDEVLCGAPYRSTF